MAEIHTLNASVRAGTGKGAARAARRENLVPGVIYGNKKTPVPITVKFNELFKMLKAGHFLTTLLTLNVDGKKEKVICRSVQRNVVNDLPSHIDFQRITAKSRIEIEIPVVFLNEETCVGIKAGGVLVVIRNEVELEVTADNIPEKIEIDIENKEIGDNIHLSDFALPEGATPVITDRDIMIASIAAPTVSLDDEEADAEASEAASEASSDAKTKAEAGDED